MQVWRVAFTALALLLIGLLIMVEATPWRAEARRRIRWLERWIILPLMIAFLLLAITQIAASVPTRKRPQATERPAPRPESAGQTAAGTPALAGPGPSRNHPFPGGTLQTR